jgi:hypothetical protein
VFSARLFEGLSDLSCKARSVEREVMPTIAGEVCDPRIVAAWTSRRMHVPARPGFGVSGLVTGDTASGRDFAYRRVAGEAGQLERSDLGMRPGCVPEARRPVELSPEFGAKGTRQASKTDAAGADVGQMPANATAGDAVRQERSGLDRTPAVAAEAQGPVVQGELERAHIERAAARRRVEAAVAVAGGVRDQSGLLRDMYQYVDRVYADFYEKAARAPEWIIDPTSRAMCWPEVETDEITAVERLRGALECFTDALFGVGSRAPVGYAQLIEYTLRISVDIGAEAAREYACGVLSQLDDGLEHEVGCVLDEWGGRLLYMVRNARSLGFSGAALQSGQDPPEAGTGRRGCKGRARRRDMRR